MSAIISDCGKYRYTLTRTTDLIRPERGPVVFIMLNPSTADADLDDPTIRRLKGFTKSWGCSGFTVANLYALRSTDPKNLWEHDDPVGPENDKWLTLLSLTFLDFVCAWGANAKSPRVAEVISILDHAGARLWCLGQTKSGSPKHPLYLKSNTPLIPFG